MERTRKGFIFDDEAEFKRWFTHAVDNKMAQAEIERLKNMHPGMSPSTQIFQKVRERPVCTKCESMAYRTQNKMAKCSNPRCGHLGPSVTYDEYITNKWYR